MTGKRVEWTDQILEAGEYSRLPDGTWHACSPNGHLANLALHTVTEHADGTATVTPSIGIGDKCDKDGRPLNNLYHGFLRRGVWSDA